MKSHLYPIIVEIMEEGGYYAECPILAGCHVEGETYAEAIENLESAIKAIIESYQDLKKPLPEVPTLEGNLVVTGAIPVPAPG